MNENHPPPVTLPLLNEDSSPVLSKHKAAILFFMFSVEQAARLFKEPGETMRRAFDNAPTIFWLQYNVDISPENIRNYYNVTKTNFGKDGILDQYAVAHIISQQVQDEDFLNKITSFYTEVQEVWVSLDDSMQRSLTAVWDLLDSDKDLVKQQVELKAYVLGALRSNGGYYPPVKDGN